MANRKEKLELGTFGDAPKFDATIPTIKGLDSDVAVATAIGRIGGGVKRVWCSTLFCFGSLAKKKGETYNPGKAWEAYYGEMYRNAPMQPGSKRTAKKEDIVWATLAQMKKWDTQAIAGLIFDHPHGSFSQKAACASKVIANHKDKAPDEKELGELLPKPKTKKGEEKDPSITARAKGIKTSIAGIRDDDGLLAMVKSNAELRNRFEKLETAASLFFDMAETVEKKAKVKAKTKADGKANVAQLQAGLKKDKPAAGEARH